MVIYIYITSRIDLAGALAGSVGGAIGARAIVAVDDIYICILYVL